MKMINIISITQILTGAFIMLYSIGLGIKIKRNVPPDLSWKWLVIVSLTGFFLFGFLLAALVLLIDITVPFELLTGGIFLAGAGFVFIIMILSKTTIHSIKAKDKQLQRTLIEISERRDIEEERLAGLNLANEQLRIVLNDAESVNRARGEFITKINREARTPLHEIVNFSESALNTDLTEEQKRHINAIKESARSIAELLDSAKDIHDIKPAH